MRPTPTAIIALLVAACVIAPGCTPRKPVEPPPPPPAAPVSIWTASDSQAVAQQVVEAATRDPWTSQFRDRNGRAARIAVGPVEDRSGKVVPTDGLVAELGSAIAKLGGEKLALADGNADFTLRGVIGGSAGTDANGAKVTFFAIDLGAADAATGDVSWHFAVERPVADR